MTDLIRVPAEWEDYNSVLIAWPHENTDWADMLHEVTQCYIDIANAIVRSGLRLVVVAPNGDLVRNALKGIPANKLFVFEAPTNDTWTVGGLNSQPIMTIW